MRRIREARNLTVGDLHEETKIPQGLIEAFEKKALFDHPQFNRVYLRSFVRTYAQVIDIGADVALEALEEALSGRYLGSLAVEYLGEEPDDVAPARRPDAPDDEPADSAGGPREERESPVDAEGERGAEEAPPVVDTPREVVDEEETGPSYVSTTQATAAGFERAAVEEDVGEDAAAEDWTAQSPPSGAAPTVFRTPTRGDSDRQWILGGVLVVVVGVLVWILASVLGGPDGPERAQVAAGDTTEAAASTDTAAAPVAQPIDIPPLGDTMNVRIVAAHGKVDPIRVTVDDDLRRPYWIEAGDSTLFRPTSRIVIEDLLDSVIVKIEGVEYPMSRRDDQGRIVITRDTALTYFSSLRAGA